MVVRVAIVAASLAWAGYVFTNTVGDPDRGERIASAVLVDDDARAEIVAPITDAVVRTTPATPEMEALIAVQVDALLQSPDGARAFIDPFAGSWARMLGEDDPRPAEFDLAPLTDELLAAVPGLRAADIPETRFDIPDVPLPRTSVDWMGDVREIVETATLVLAASAVAGFLIGFMIGDRRWVLRRVGLWAAFAGAGWVVIPLLITWAAGRWATGADSVIEIAVREAVSGLRTTALILMLAGIACFALSFVPAIGRLLAGPDRPRHVEPGTVAAPVPAVRRRHTPDTEPPRQRVQTRAAVEADFRPPPAAAPPRVQRPRTVEPTAEMPHVRRQRDAAFRRPVGREADAVPTIRELAVDSPDVDPPGDDDLWDYYAPRG